MQFDWNLLSSDKALSEAQASLAREICESFLTTGMGISDHQKRVELGRNRNLLNELIQLGLIRNNWNRYYPSFPGLLFVESPLRDSYAGTLDLIIKSVKALYERIGPQRFSFQQIEEQLNELLSGSNPVELAKMIRTDAYIQRATLFLQDFPHLLQVLESDYPAFPATTVIALDNILDYEGLQKAWEYELAQRPTHIKSSEAPFEKGPEKHRAGNDPESSQAKSKKVFVIHGRDEKLRAGTFDFLRALHLDPLEWVKAIQLTGKASPYIGEILEAAFGHAQAVVVLLSPDDEAKLRADLIQADDPHSETVLTGQARPNVLFEAGMAFGSQSNQTVLVQFGQVRPFSDIAGRHVVRMDNSAKKRQEFAIKLKTVGCSVDMEGTDWHTAGDLTPPTQRTETLAPLSDRDPQISHRTSNIVSLKPLSTPRRIGPDDSDTWRDVEPLEGNALAAVAIFRNEAIKGISLHSVEGLIAQITFYEPNGGEVQRIHHGTWLGDPYNHTSLGVGDTRELIIAISHPNWISASAIENTRARSADYQTEGSRERLLERRQYDVKVHLIGSVAAEGDFSEQFHFNLDLRGDTPILKLGWAP